MNLEALSVAEGGIGLLHKLTILSNMVADGFTEVVYQRLLHNITLEGWQANHLAVSLSPPSSPTRAHFNSIFPNGTTFFRKDPQ